MYDVASTSGNFHFTVYACVQECKTLYAIYDNKTCWPHTAGSLDNMVAMNLINCVAIPGKATKRCNITELYKYKIVDADADEHIF